jgi:GINS complex subunit 3
MFWSSNDWVSKNASNASTISLDLPTSLSTHVMNALKADAHTVDLRSLAPHFYSLGARILDIFEDDELVDVLSDVRCPLSAFVL